jgi:MRG-binding protein
MHKHFRMIAISEHLRNHGFDPDVYQHTRIPFIWQKLRTYYNLEIIDERENFDDDEPEDRYAEFTLPRKDFLEAMLQRAIADPSETASSPPELDLEGTSAPLRKRKRGDTRTRSTPMDDTEDATDTQSPAARSTRGSRGRTRAASHAKAEKADKAETTEEEEGNDNDAEDVSDDGNDGGDDDDDDDDEEDEGESSSEAADEAPRSTRGSTRGRGRGRGRGRRGRRG